MQRYRADYANKDETGWLVSYAEAEAAIAEADKKANKYWSRFWEKESYGGLAEARKQGAQEEREAILILACGSTQITPIGIQTLIESIRSRCASEPRCDCKRGLGVHDTDCSCYKPPELCPDYCEPSHVKGEPCPCPCHKPPERKPMEKVRTIEQWTDEGRGVINLFNAIVDIVNRHEAELRGMG
jgi:hypothetical protein